MRLLVRHLNGSLQAAILIATFGGKLRVSIPACDDAVGFRWVDGQWLAENGDAVEIHFDAAPDEFCWCVQQAAETGQVALHPRILQPWAAHGLHAATVAPVN